MTSYQIALMNAVRQTPLDRTIDRLFQDAMSPEHPADRPGLRRAMSGRMRLVSVVEDMVALFRTND